MDRKTESIEKNERVNNLNLNQLVSKGVPRTSLKVGIVAASVMMIF